FRDDEATVAGRIREARLTAARDELAERAGVRVASVAYGVGFSDHAQFTRLFRRRFGLAPSDFARAAKGGD
ncbi:MAG: helix-turn-helix domain-containing protein, partial [Pseudomonadota bacterium]